MFLCIYIIKYSKIYYLKYILNILLLKIEIITAYKPQIPYPFPCTVSSCSKPRTGKQGLGNSIPCLDSRLQGGLKKVTSESLLIFGFT